MMNTLEIFNESTVQKEKFRIAGNKLLNHCFLLRKKEDTKTDYIFVIQNKELFIPYFELLGYEIHINEDQGVIALVNSHGSGRLSLKKYESIMLLLFRLLYIEKRKEIGSYSDEVVVLMEELREKYAALRIEAKPIMDKKMEQSIISLFRRYNIVKNIEGDVNQSDTRIIIYPSVMMAVTVENINEYYENSVAKLSEYKGDKDNDES
jgi:hypothetical protein